MAEESPYTTFFIAPEWVETWIETFGPVLAVKILVFRSAGQAVGACLLVRRKVRVGPFRLRCVFLNATGEDEPDSLSPQFNNLLCLESWEAACARALADYVDAEPWDEIRLNAFCPGPPRDALCQAWEGVPQSVSVFDDYYVDLKQLRQTGTSYEASLGYRTRKRVRQIFRLYGETRVSLARDLPEALAMLEELAALHQNTWEGRNRPGAFASERFKRFQRSLIRRGIGAGSIQVCRIEATSGPVGLIHSFVHRGKVYCYLCGLSYSAEKWASPGFLSFSRNIQYCLEQPGLDEFHFMAGTDHYKRQLAKSRRPLEWIVLRTSNWRNETLELLRRLKRRWVARRRKEEVGSSATETESD